MIMVCGHHDHFARVWFDAFHEINMLFFGIISETNRCSLSTLNDFISDSAASRGLDVSSQRVLVDPNEGDEVLIGSYILLYCMDGYRNTDNNLNVTCNANGQWSTFPNCISLTTARPTGMIS